MKHVLIHRLIILTAAFGLFASSHLAYAQSATTDAATQKKAPTDTKETAKTESQPEKKTEAEAAKPEKSEAAKSDAAPAKEGQAEPAADEKPAAGEEPAATENKTAATEDKSAAEGTTATAENTDATEEAAAQKETPAEEVKEISPEEATISLKQDDSLSDAPAKQSTDESQEKKGPKRNLFIISYDMAIPIGPTHDFSEDFSARGMGFEYRFHITPQLAVGALIGWQAFETKDKGTFRYDQITITGTQIRTMESMPLAASFQYNILPIENKVAPFVGLDLGAYRIWKNTNFGWASASDAEWHFGVAPKVGVIFQLAQIPVFIGSKFHLIARTKDAEENYYVGFNIGVGLKR